MLLYLAYLLVMLSMLLCAAIFGFFYAWVCSTMWGLDATDPRVAIQAMQAMNASVRNAVFAPAFFGTPIVLLLTSSVLWLKSAKASSIAFGVSGLTYFCLALVPTATINVPMNEALASISVPQDIDTARQIWVEYSKPWQFWNQARTLTSGISFVFALIGIFYFPRSAIT